MEVFGEKSYIAEKLKERETPFRLIKRFIQTESFKNIQGVPFERILQISEKVAQCRKKPKGGTFWSRLYFWKHKKIFMV